MTTLLIVSIIIASLGVIMGVLYNRAIPKSISSLAWLFKGHWRWCWTIWLWIIAFLMVPSLVSSLPDEWKFIGFIFHTLLIFLGAIPSFDVSHEKQHTILAILAGILSQICVFILCPWWLFMWIIIPIVIWYIPIKLVFFCEIICMATLYGCLLI